MPLLIVVAVNVIAMIGAYLLIGRPERGSNGKRLPSPQQRRKLFDEANRFINQAEMAEPSAAASLYQSAFHRAQQIDDGLLCSEALVGLARVRIKQGLNTDGITVLERALQYRPWWYEDKPNYARLIKRMIEQARFQSSRAHS